MDMCGQPGPWNGAAVGFSGVGITAMIDWELPVWPGKLEVEL